MIEFWEETYRNNEKMWGEKPTDNSFTVLKLLQKQNIKNLLIPGFGYGRNAKVFYDNGIEVTGIEISKTAIERAHKYFESDVKIHFGSVTKMPFDKNQYQSIYCYSLIHLLNKTDRKKLIKDCYTQLEYNGVMIFVALSINDKRFGVGEKLEHNTFYSPQGLNLFFYDEVSIKEEFGDYNILKTIEINEPLKKPNEKHWMIICKKTSKNE
ncbi:class I SAM-dependent methyltransferase [Rasiella rasia]|uniref:Class I SAM-dependent methyltransferase n=1 Tax=Rasiella rasia TaxID=2744027 RepID=A0A6G6GHQ5_9FLAO|nr:class I SAM-dependent methyltransferase [Rasiella rasia]QIE58047.1 class I SAM-dependent methyltransferase [Rasiella rasia]